MTDQPPTLLERFQGCLLGLAVGDALGGVFEARSADHIRRRCPTVQALLDDPREEIWYTDDTQMAIGVAETLADCGAIDEGHLCRAFVANYVPARGYGRGARAVLDAMETGSDHRAVAELYFPGGSYGNGAAMRVAPVGLVFRDDPARLWEQARRSALPTHVHPLGVEGAQVLALAVALATSGEPLDRDAYLGRLHAACATPEFRRRLESARLISRVEDLALLGNSITALDSVVTAVASFTLTPDSYADTVANVIFLGGDTDTLAAMAGAVSGAYLGIRGVPARLVGLLESSPKGRDYLFQLAERLTHRAETP